MISLHHTNALVSIYEVYMHLLEKFHAIDLQLSRLEFRCFPKIFWMCFDIWSLEKLSVTGNHL